MGCEDMFSGCKKILTLAAMATLLAGFIGAFITTITWWSRIHPWFSHGDHDGKTVYQCLTACWVLSIVGAVATAFFLLATLCIKSICDNITGNKIALIIVFILVGGVSVGSIISGGYGASFALKNPDDDDNKDQKCFKYLSSGFADSLAWAMKNRKKWDDYIKWRTDLLKHASKNDVYTGYLCRDVGAPTMTFILVQCVAIILFVVIIIMALIC